MRITQLSNNLLQVTFFRLVNCYVLREDDGLTIVDTAIKGREKEIVAAAARLGTPIRRILLTHAHVDHMGSLDGLKALLGDVDVAISEREAPLLHKDLSLRPNEPQQKPKGGFPGAATQPSHMLTDGELYGSLRCINTPGHTPGHMSFLDERDGTLIAGDALVTVRGRLAVVNDAPWYFPFPKFATWDRRVAVESARRLVGIRPAAVAAGHGRFIPDATKLAEAVERAARAL